MSTVFQIFQISRNQFYSFRLNPLSLVDICTPVVNRFEDAEEALQFLEKIGDKVKANTEAFVMTRVLIGKLQLLQFKDVPKTKATVEEIDGLLNDVEGVGRVHAHYYLLATELYKSEGDHANYYRCVKCENSSVATVLCMEITEIHSNVFVKNFVKLTVLLNS